jgi:hypothetical protein
MGLVRLGFDLVIVMGGLDGTHRVLNSGKDQPIDWILDIG